MNRASDIPHPRPASGETAHSLRLAAIDVGSNSIHMIVAQADTDGGITTLWRLKEPVGLGRMSFPSRELSKEAIDRAVSVLGRFQQHAIQRQSEKIVAVATSAVREAANGGELIERVRDELGLTLKVVSAREEARLIYLAVRHAMPLKRNPHLIVDIGGGSVEFIVGDEQQAQMLESRKLGAARMTATYVKSDPISEADQQALLDCYQSQIGSLCEQIVALKPASAIGTSGTLENIAAMCKAENHGANGEPSEPGVIDKEAFEGLLSELKRSRSKDRAKIRGLDDGRKDQIVAGALLVGELFKRLRIKRIMLCPAALREGILLDYLNRHLPDLQVRRDVPDPRRRSVLDLARRCDWHKTHAEQTARLCLQLFDALKPLHGLGAGERELIEYAALLHDIGWHIGRQDHHKHSEYLILHGDLKNFSDEEIQTIAAIARYHRRPDPKPKHRNYGDLSKPRRQAVKVGAALLRLADAMDRSHGSVVQEVQCRIHGKHADCAMVVKGDAELELWAARKKMNLFNAAFDKSISFELVKR